MATSGEDKDYMTLSETPVFFRVSETSQTVDIYINDDGGNVDALNETFCVELDKSISMRGQPTPLARIMVTIVNDDSKFYD